VAEPAAFVAQRLVAPARRAFSRPGLDALLTRAGFHVAAFVASDGTFVACMATTSGDPAWQHLSRAGRLGSASPDEALAELALAGKSGCRNMQREAHLAAAELLTTCSDGDGAVRAYLAAAQLDPADPRPLAGLALLTLRSGAPEDAFDLAARALRLDPTLPDAARALASAADELSSTEAWNTWRIAQRLAPDDLAISSRVAAHAAERGDYAFGIAAFEKLRAYGDPLPVDYSVTLSLLLAADGRRADALVELDLARAMAPGDPALDELAVEIQTGG
jgi:tetratricopeptide (TPR) repeat protein